MKNNKPAIFVAILGLVVGMAFWSATAQSDSQKSGKMEGCRPMMQERQQMMSQMKEENAQLERLVSRLEEASGQNKVDVLAQIVTRMVNERLEKAEKMEAMHGRMMQHMSQHMQKGAESMAQCPMMGNMEAMGGAEADEEGHSEHHQDSSETK